MGTGNSRQGVKALGIALGVTFFAATANAQADVGVGGANVGIGGIQIQVPGVNVPLPGVEVQVPEVGAQLGQSGSNPTDSGQAVPSDDGTNSGGGDAPTSEPPADTGGGDTGGGSDPGGSTDTGGDSGTGTGAGTDTGAGTGSSVGDPAASGSGRDGGGGDGNGGGSQPGPGQGADSTAPAAASSQSGDGGNGPRDEGADAKEDSGEPTLSTRVGDVISDIPSGILVALVLVTILGLLMTGRSAWFARATKRLKLQRRSLEEDVGVLASALVPSLPDELGGTAIAAAYTPAGGPASGGDFHDVFELDGGRIGMVVGDISGHGREAVPKTGIVRFTLRAYLEAGYEPRMALRMADQALSGNFGDDFATAVVATWDPATRRLVYSAAGHPKPIVVGDDPPAEVDVLGAPPIGIGHTSGTRQTTLALGTGSEIWLFSDGLTEAHEPGGRALGREGLRKRLRRRPTPEELLSELPGIEDESRDDLTALRIRPDESRGDFEPFSVETLLVESTHDETAIAEFLDACGLEGDDHEGCAERISVERRQEGQVLIRISRLDDVLHWRVERVDPKLSVPPGLPVSAAPTPS